MKETKETGVGLCCMGHRKTLWFRWFIVAVGIGVWLFPGDTTTLAKGFDWCLDLCLPPDCNGNQITDACDLDCNNVGPVCAGNDCHVVTCFVQACGQSSDCNSNGIPDECDPDCDGNGLPDDCESSVACCLTGGCSDLDPDCCTAQGGTSQGSGSSCGSTEACCFANSSLCSDLDPVCCTGQGGVPAGSGTSCTDFGGNICSASYGCCNPNHPAPGDFECPNHTIYECVTVDEGNPIPGVPCQLTGGDTDGDGVHNLCDPCPNSNPDDADGDGVCGDVDNCPNDFNPNQEDCDLPPDGVGDACEPDCDGNGTPDDCDTEPDCDDDGIPNDCDPDIDDDGVFNADDVCDYTPLSLTVETSGLFIGTVRADLDGDCDVDSDDSDELTALLGDSTCDPFNGVPSEEPLCVQTICDPCNSCCFFFPR